MSERDTLMRAAERFLELVPVQTRERGRFYYTAGHVIDFTCVTPDQKICTAVVRGSAIYAVTLKYSEQNWISECSCPMQYDCKHTVAAMLELQRLWAKEASESPPSNKAAKKKSPRAARTLVPPPPPSPLHSRLVEQLGRPLNYAESVFVRKVQMLHANTGIRLLTESDLSQLFPQQFGYGWTGLELWPKPPQDDYECWLYLAAELRRRKVPPPDYMVAITDYAMVEAALEKWERQKEVDRWQT